MEFITQIELAQYEKADVSNFEKSNFAFSFSILPKEERNAMNSIYAFCSYIDDIVDSPGTEPTEIKKKLDRLLWWENQIDKIYSGNLDSKILSPFIKVISRFNIPKQYFITLIHGCRRDLVQKRYETFEELKEYCYGVAGVVGLISIEVFGHKYEETKNYAINLGYALQLTNILRDIKFDNQRGYIYLPQEDLRRFNYTEDDIAGAVYNDNFYELMRFEAARVRQYYHKARTLLHPDERITIFSAEVMDAIYYRLLEKIELNNFRIYDKKIRVSTPHKLYLTFKHWLSARLLVARIKKNNP